MKGQRFRTVPDSKSFAANSVPDTGSKGTTLLEIWIDSTTYATATKRDSKVAFLISEVLHDRLVIPAMGIRLEKEIVSYVNVTVPKIIWWWLGLLY